MKVQKGDQKTATAGILGLLAVVFMKFKFAILAAFKAVPLLKLGWLLKSSAGLLLSLGLYTAMWGWRYAVTLIILIYIHEMGHYIWMKAYGLNPKAPVFVPFFGAYVAMTNMPEDIATHAWVAYAGPLVGGVGAFVFYWWGLTTGNHFLVAAASTGFMLNLLQLVPVKPFDGGFIAQGISRWLAIPGVIIALLAALSFHSVLLLIILVPALLRTISDFRSPQTYAGSTQVTPGQRIAITLAYFSLAGALAGLFWLSGMRLSGVLPASS